MLLLALTLCSCYPIILAFVPSTNIPTPLSYEDMISHMKNITHDAYMGYPERDNVTMSYPSPKGSKVILHPGLNTTWSVETNVLIYVTVEGLSGLDIANQYLQLIVEESFLWHDKHFKMDGAARDDFIEIHHSKIWTPEILPDGVYDVQTLSETPTVRVSLYDGHCFQTRQISYAIPCSVNVQPFPFDIHTCSLRLYQKQRLNTRMKFLSAITPALRRKEEDQLSLIMSNNAAQSFGSDTGTLEFVIRNFSSKVIKRIRSNNDQFETDAYSLKLIISRRSVFYAIVLILPCMLLNILSFMIFTLNLKDTERENYAVTLILTYFVLIMIVVDSSPSSGSHTPLLGLYIILSMCIVLGDFLISVVLIEIHEHYRERDKPVPEWLTNCLNTRLVIMLFTHKRHFKKDDNTHEQTELEDLGENKGMLQKELKKRKAKRSIKDTKDEYKWKVFLKVLNFISFIISLLAHIILVVAMCCKLPSLPDAE